MLEKIISWAQKEDSIRAMLLTGSRAKKNNSLDAFSDFDVALFVTNQKKYTSNDSWIHDIDTVLVYIPEIIQCNNQEIPVRLIIFKDGIGTDIALWSTNHLQSFVDQKQLPFACDEGYTVLLDKDDIAKQLPVASGKRLQKQKPSEEEFFSTINVFFFEAFQCAKYLARKDLWHAKLRDWTTKEYLLKMIEWHEKSTHGWNYDTFWHGKNMQSWCSKETWKALDNCFAHFDASDSWKALLAIIALFRTIAMQAAENLGYKYPVTIDKNITDLVQKIIRKESQNAQ